MDLNQQTITTLLNTAADQDYLPYQLHIFDTVTSTNQIAWNLVAAGAKPGTAVIATQQTAGRGQWGRQWLSTTGGLYLSVAFAPQICAVNSYELTFATAWGIASQLRQQGIPVGIKWPNDLVINDRKLGGILTETKISKGKINTAVIGVGINWANEVPDTGINLQSWLKEQTLPEVQAKLSTQNSALKNQHSLDSLEKLAAVTLIGIRSGWQFYAQEGIDKLLPAYMELLTSMGREVNMNDQSGIVVGVTKTGELRVIMTTSSSNACKNPEIVEIKPGTINLGYQNSES